MVQNTNDNDLIDFEADSLKTEKSKKKVNIFDDFGGTKDLKEEITQTKKQQDKDMFFYVEVISKVLQIGFFILFFVVLVGWLYVIIQKNESITSQSFLDPMCNVFVGDIPYPETNCPSISSMNKHYKEKLDNEKKQQAGKVLDLLPFVYQNYDFLNSKEVSFLLDKTEDRLKVLEVLSEFDKMKNNFTGLERGKIICSNFTIEASNKTLTSDCRAFSRGYESSIKGFSGESKNIRGTSISVANSFLNFIEKKSDYFSLLDKQKIFDTKVVIDGNNGYTQETNFKLTLKINN